MKNNKTTKLFGIVITICLSFIVLLLIIGKEPIKNISTNFLWGTTNDASKDFYNTYYHVKYDTCYLKNNIMNYPYGENYTYTGAQAHISIPLKYLQNLFQVDLSNQVLFWVNLCIFISFILCSLFLFLIFYELDIHWLFSIASAVAITYISPQISRISCHMTLSYAFIIPCVIYLFLKWHKNKKWTYSIFLSLITFISGIIHPYFIVFIAGIWLFVTIYSFINTESTKRKKILLHSILQFIIPCILFLLLTNIDNNTSDRTAIPDGFYFFKSKWKSIFLPVERFTNTWDLNTQMEGHAFIGYFAVFFIIFTFYDTIYKYNKVKPSKWKEIFIITDNNFLNLLFYIGILFLILSCCIPFKWGIPARFLNYIGPLAQFRSLGRLSWLFYYIINIIAIYAVYKILKKKGEKFKDITILVCSIIIASYAVDIYMFNKYRNFSNQSAEFLDYNNKLEQNQWLNNFNANKYQSILALPFHSNGSEHLKCFQDNKIINKTNYIIEKTGLPTHLLNSSRTKIHQAYNNYAFHLEPYLPYKVLDDMPSQKPILIITSENPSDLNENEKRILSYATFLFNANKIDFYEITIDKLKILQQDFAKTKKEETIANKIYKISTDIYSNDSLNNYFFETFDNEQGEAFQGKAAKSCKISEWNTIYEGINPVKNYDSLEISFLINNYLDDLMHNTKMEIIIEDSYKNCKIHEEYFIRNFLKNIFGEWALINFTIPNTDIAENDNIKISLINYSVKKGKTTSIDNLIIKPTTTNIVSDFNGITLLNNCPINSK